MIFRNILKVASFFIVIVNFDVVARVDRPGEVAKWVISESSNLRVNGSTNINNFSCDILRCDETDTLILEKSKVNKEIPLSGEISLNIQSFDCHKTMMTRELRKILKEKEYPRLKILFLSLNKLPDLTDKPVSITGQVDIEIAGIQKRYVIDYQISEDAKKNIDLLGSKDLKFSDFKLQPPTKLGGLIKTSDKLSVTFNLKMKAIE